MRRRAAGARGSDALLPSVLALLVVVALALVSTAARADDEADGGSADTGSAEGAGRGRPDPGLEAETARAAGLFDLCIEKDLLALEKDESPTTHAHLAGCAEKAGKLVLALRHLQNVLDAAVASKDAEVAELAEQRVVQLLKRVAMLTVSAPPNVKDLVVRVDDAPLGTLGKAIPVDPGKHRVSAEGVLESTPMTFEEIVTVGPGERAEVTVALRPRASEFLTLGQIECMQLAKTQEEVLKCLPEGSKPLVVRAALEASGYGDTLSVLVFSPALRASVTSPTHGWNVSATYLVDMISAASPDFVSTASPRGKDTRHGLSATAGYKPKRFGVEAAGSFSDESDYTSRGGNLAVLADFFDKRVTPRLGYGYTHDTIGRGGTPYDVFSNTLRIHEMSGGASVVLSPRSVLVLGVTLGVERGDPSKPYRLVPMFARGVGVPAAASADLVNALRLSVRPYEQLPLERDRFAFGARFIHRFGGSTLRLEERLYDDSWGLVASSTDARYLVDLGSRVTAGPHVRFHIQSRASFFQRVYHADTQPRLVVPRFRTTDRELGPLNAFTGGASVWLKLTTESPGLLLYFSGDVMSTRYVDSLYVSSRLAAYGTLGVEAQFE